MGTAKSRAEMETQSMPKERIVVRVRRERIWDVKKIVSRPTRPVGRKRRVV